MTDPAIALSPEAAAHDLLLLLHSVPESIKNALFDLDVDEWLSGADIALRKAEWCEAMAACRASGTVDHSSMPDYHREVYREAARLLCAALPGLPEHAPPEVLGFRQSVDEAYSASVAKADRRYWRRRR